MLSNEPAWMAPASCGSTLPALARRLDAGPVRDGPLQRRRRRPDVRPRLQLLPRRRRPVRDPLHRRRARAPPGSPNGARATPCACYGPLGNGCTFPIEPGNLLLVGGGVGVAPLVDSAERAVGQGHQVVAMMGARTAAHTASSPRALAEGSGVRRRDRGRLGRPEGLRHAAPRASTRSGPARSTPAARTPCSSPSPRSSATTAAASTRRS